MRSSTGSEERKSMSSETLPRRRLVSLELAVSCESGQPTLGCLRGASGPRRGLLADATPGSYVHMSAMCNSPRKPSPTRAAPSARTAEPCMAGSDNRKTPSTTRVHRHTASSACLQWCGSTARYLSVIIHRPTRLMPVTTQTWTTVEGSDRGSASVSSKTKRSGSPSAAGRRAPTAVARTTLRARTSTCGRLLRRSPRSPRTSPM
mmetsp:Transcript_6205/g.19017  ORF Transcript_6205/g.19017 Transcript_6205/m.19017 type:complete len:205 (-) Transcript_6205:863-1477(-)